MTLVPDVPRQSSNVAPRTRLDCRAVAEGYLKPLANHDFRWVFLTRFLMQQVGAFKFRILSDDQMCT